MNADKIDETAREVAKLVALLNDKHPNLISWRFVVEQQTAKVVDMLCDNILPPEYSEDRDE